MLHATHIGTATLLLEFEGLRLVTDPVFDAPGQRYNFGWGTRSTHLEMPAMTAAEVGPIDAVLLSHDQHGDNLDHAGRTFLMTAPRVITTHVAAARLGHPSAVGLRPFASTRLGALTITATPARHGPPGSLPIVGHVIGFIIEGAALPGPIYISGDTVWFNGVAEVARRFRPLISFLHLGSVQFPISGPLRYTFNAEEAATAANALGSPQIIPVHYEGWTHFREPSAHARDVFKRAGLAEKIRWLTRGSRTQLLSVD